MTAMLEVKQRNDLRHSNTRELRNTGKVPAIVYGKDKGSHPVYVDEVEFLKTFREVGKNAVVTLNIDNGQKESVMLQEMQTDPLKGEVVHVDFRVVDMSSEVDVSVPILLTGEATGVKDEGGILQQPVYEVGIRALPSEIPENIEVDISNLAVGDTLLLSDVASQHKYEFKEDLETVIASILPPNTEEEVDSGEKQTPDEPDASPDSGEEQKDAEGEE